MERKFLSLAAAAVGVMLVAWPVWAHHSHNAYEVTVWTTMEGTVTEIHYILPHSWVYLDVKDDKGASAIWALEAAGPMTIFRKRREEGRHQAWRQTQSALSSAPGRLPAACLIRHAHAWRSGARPRR